MREQECLQKEVSNVDQLALVCPDYITCDFNFHNECFQNEVSNVDQLALVCPDYITFLAPSIQR